MIAIILGTRAELVKLFPVMLELQRKKQPYVFIHTGQHSLGNLIKIFGVKKPGAILTIEPKKKTTKFFGKKIKAATWLASLIFKIKKALKQIPDLRYVLYQGDTMSTAVAAIASSRLLNPFKKYKSIHIEAGLRSGSLSEPFPEEIARKIADNFSEILFAVSAKAERNLKKEIKSKKRKIINVGNTVADSSFIAYNIAKKQKIALPKEDYALVTLHRHENIKSKERLKAIVDILRLLPIKTIFPLHDNTKKQLMRFGLYQKLLRNKNIKITKLKGYIEFIYLLKHCKLLLTDGGSIQEESLIFKKPCIILRKRTERIEGLDTGINFLTKLDVNYAKKIIKKILSPDYRLPAFKNPYGKPGVSKKIVNYF